MRNVMPAQAGGPLAETVMERLSAWLATEGYSSSMVPQVLGVARGLSAWMAEHDFGVQDLTLGVLDAFGAEYGPGVPGHALVGQRLPALRRFLGEGGYRLRPGAAG